MSSSKVAVIDYGMGNVWSVMSAFKYLGAEVDLVSDPEVLEKSEILVLPGVGSFRKGAEALRNRGIDEAIGNAVASGNSKILGICLGMQLMGSYGTEDGGAEGLGLLSNRVERFTPEELGGMKIPHVGFNEIRYQEQSGLFEGLTENPDFYFVHSYRMLLDNFDGPYALCRYGSDFLAAFETGNIYGTQFHPEKSQTNGLILLRNFMRSKISC